MNFVWLEKDRLAACRGPRSTTDLKELRDIGIGAVVRLAETDEQMVSSADVHGVGLDDLPLAVQNYHAPTQVQIGQAVQFIKMRLDEDARSRSPADGGTAAHRRFLLAT